MPPRTVVIAGGGRKVGKTELAEGLAALLGDAAVVKLGVHHPRPGRNELYFDRDTPWKTVLERVRGRRFAILESGSILDDPDLEPDLVIFLPAPGGDKPGAEERRARADLVRGEPPSPALVEGLRARLGVDAGTMERLLRAVSA